MIRIYQYEVGLITGADVASSFNMIKFGRCMAHFLNQLLYA